MRVEANTHTHTHTHSPICVVAPGPDPDPENYIFTNSQHHHPPNQAPAKKAPTNQAPKKYECGKLGPYIIKYICIRYILQQLANIYMSVAFIYWYWNLDIYILPTITHVNWRVSVHPAIDIRVSFCPFFKVEGWCGQTKRYWWLLSICGDLLWLRDAFKVNLDLSFPRKPLFTALSTWPFCKI